MRSVIKRYKFIKAKQEISINGMIDLYHHLCSDGMFFTDDYDPYEKAVFEKAGYDYFKETSKYFDVYEDDMEWDDFIAQYNLPGLTEHEIYQLIHEEISSNSDVKVYYSNTCQEIAFNDDGSVMEYINVEE